MTLLASYMTPDELEYCNLVGAQLEREKEKNRESKRKWVAANPEKAKAYNRTWREANPEKVRELGRAWRAANLERRHEYDREWYKANSGKRRKYNLRKKYKLSETEWNAKFEAQGRCCAVCRATDPGSKSGWHTDHCKKTGQVRGILCHPCNIMVGNHNQFRLRDAADYVERWSKLYWDGPKT